MVPLRCRTNGHQRSGENGASIGRQVSSVQLTLQLPREAGIMFIELRMDNSLMQMNRQLDRPCSTFPVNQKKEQG